MQAIRLSPLAVRDLKNSGLTDETIEEAQILPLTNETFKKYLHFSLIETPTRMSIIHDGYIIPYLTATETFGRCKILSWNLHSHKYKTYSNPPKYLQPPGSRNHLYILPYDLQLLQSPKTSIVITEGEKKTLKLSQELRKLPHRFAAVGCSGVYNWKGCDEWQKFSLKDRKVLIAFDADGFLNPQVAKAELELLSFLLSQGVRTAKSLVWDASLGKGIDDYLNGREEELERLLSSAVDPILKYSDTLSLESALEALAKHLKELPPELVESLKKAYSASKRRIDKAFKEAREAVLEKIKLKSLQEQIELVKSSFKIDFDPKIPEFFYFRDSYLWHKDEKLCEAFVVKSTVVSLENTGSLAELQFLNGKELVISDRELSNHKRLCETFNKHGLFIDETKAKKVNKYISEFIADNPKLPRKTYVAELGWKDKKFYLPQTTTNCLFDDQIVGVEAVGSEEKELQAVRELAAESDAVLYWFIGLLAPTMNIIYPTQPTAVFYTHGRSGAGKTVSNLIALSTYGSPHELMQNMNFTSVGEELYLSTHKDLAVLFDEVETKASRQDRIANEIAELIYRFMSGKGRTRANTNVRLRRQHTFRGCLLLTAERSLESVLIGADDTTKLNHGVFRRTIQIPASRLKLLSDNFFDLFEILLENHGNLIGRWVEYAYEQREKLTRLTNLYIEGMKEQGYQFAGQEKVLGALSAVIETASYLFGIDSRRLDKVIQKLKDYNFSVFSDTVKDPLRRFYDDLDDFINENRQHFVLPSDDLEKKRLPKFYGKVDADEIAVTPGAFKLFCSRYKYDKNALLEMLEEKDLIAKTGDRNRSTIYLFGERKKVYRIFLPNEDEEEIAI